MRRVAIRVLAYGALGLMTTVIVSWCFALKTNWMTGPRRNFRNGLFMLEFRSPEQNTTWTFFPITQWGVMQLSAGNSGPDDSANPVTLPAERMAEEQEVPKWSVMRRGDARGVFDALYLEQAFGFPMLAMAQEFRWSTGQPAPQV